MSPPEKGIPPPLCLLRDLALTVQPHTEESSDRGKGGRSPNCPPPPDSHYPSWLPGHAISITLKSGPNTHQGQMCLTLGRWQRYSQTCRVFLPLDCLYVTTPMDRDHHAPLEPKQQADRQKLPTVLGPQKHEASKAALFASMPACSLASRSAESSIRHSHSIPPARLDHAQRNGNVRNGNHSSQTAHP